MNSVTAWTCYKKHLTLLWKNTNSNAFNQVYDTVSPIPRLSCKRPSPSLWIPKWGTLPRRDKASLAWPGSILPFVNVQEVSFSSKLQHKRCVKGKRINRGTGYGLEIPDEYIFYDNEKAIQWAKRTLDGVAGDVKEKVLRCVKYILKKISYFQLVFCFFLACPLLGRNFHRNNPNRNSTFCPLTRGVRYCCPLFRGFFIRGLY